MSGEFDRGERVVVVGSNYWASYTGRIIGPWPDDGREVDWLVQLDNGMNIRADGKDLKREAKEEEAMWYVFDPAPELPDEGFPVLCGGYPNPTFYGTFPTKAEVVAFTNDAHPDDESGSAIVLKEVV